MDGERWGVRMLCGVLVRGSVFVLESYNSNVMVMVLFEGACFQVEYCMRILLGCSVLCEDRMAANRVVVVVGGDVNVVAFLGFPRL